MRQKVGSAHQIIVAIHEGIDHPDAVTLRISIDDPLTVMDARQVLTKALRLARDLYKGRTGLHDHTRRSACTYQLSWKTNEGIDQPDAVILWISIDDPPTVIEARKVLAKALDLARDFHEGIIGRHDRRTQQDRFLAMLKRCSDAGATQSNLVAALNRKGAALARRIAECVRNLRDDHDTQSPAFMETWAYWKIAHDTRFFAEIASPPLPEAVRKFLFLSRKLRALYVFLRPFDGQAGIEVFYAEALSAGDLVTPEELNERMRPMRALRTRRTEDTGRRRPRGRPRKRERPREIGGETSRQIFVPNS